MDAAGFGRGWTEMPRIMQRGRTEGRTEMTAEMVRGRTDAAGVGHGRIKKGSDPAVRLDGGQDRNECINGLVWHTHVITTHLCVTR